jgi:hypothetical protein
MLDRIYERYIFNTVLLCTQCYTSAASQNILHDSLITRVQRGPYISDFYVKAAGSAPPPHYTPTSVDVSRFLFVWVSKTYMNTTQRSKCIH